MLIPFADWDSPCLEKLNALDWKVGFSIDFDGSFLGVRCDCVETGERVRVLAQEYGTLVDKERCDWLISVKRARQSERKGVRHYNILYSNHNAIIKSFDLDEILERVQDLFKLGTVTLLDHLVHIDDSRLFAWEADDRMISVVGSDGLCRGVVLALRPYLMPERTSFTSIAEDGTVTFAPWELNWRGRIVHQPRPLTDMVFFLEEGETPLGLGEAVLRLYELSSGKVPAEKRIPLLASALRNVRIHSIPVGDLSSLGQRVADALGLGVTARQISEKHFYSEA